MNIQNKAQLKDCLVEMMETATSNFNTANQTVEKKVTYSFDLEARNPAWKHQLLPFPDHPLLTIRVTAYGSSAPTSLDKYIEEFCSKDTHSSMLETESEVETTHNHTTMRCKIFISEQRTKTQPEFSIGSIADFPEH
jgi:hypothetical protein